jgi:hypothetical protein
MYGRVVNKKARWNLCFSDYSQNPDYVNGKGTIINLQNVPLTNYLYNSINKFINNDDKLHIEANYYYDITKCGIGYHGDAERKKVIGIRLGKSFPISFSWHYKNNKISDNIIINNIENGDMYIMSEKATGNDWKRKNIYTLRHAAGCNKYIN